VKPKDFRKDSCVPDRSIMDPEIPYSKMSLKELIFFRDVYSRCVMDFLSAWSAVSKELSRRATKGVRKNGKRDSSG